MASSISCGCPLWVDDVVMSGQSPFRQYDIGARVYNAGTASANQVPGGVFPGLGAMAVTVSSGLNIGVNAGYCCVPNSSSSLQGGYIFGLMNSVTLQIAAADTVNPRIDLVVANVQDLGSSASFCQVQVVTGTPASPAVAPALPANSIALGQVYVAANITSVISGNITDLRTYVVAPGGILPIANAAAAPAMPASQFMYRLDTGQLVQGTGSAGSVAAVPSLKWVPQLVVVTSSVHAGGAGSLTQVATLSVTVDGSTDIEVYLKWPGVIGNASYMSLLAVIDSTTVDTIDVISSESSQPTGGGSARYFTSASQSNTPAAGTHNIYFKFQAQGSGTSTSDGVYASGSALAMLRCSPVST